jgi:hypothetical protein
MTAYSETSSTKIPKQEVNNQNPKSGPNFVLVNSGSSISSLFGDILPSIHPTSNFLQLL